MKKHFNPKLLFVSLAVVLAFSFIFALIPLFQNIEANTFGFGFPLTFFTVRVGEFFNFSTHLNLVGLCVNVLIVYVFACLYGGIVAKYKHQ